MASRHLAIIAAAGVLLSSAMSAHAEGWVAQRVTGKAWLVWDGGFEPLKRGASVAPGVTVQTKAGARVMLVRGGTTVTVGPNSVMAISRLKSDDEKTTVLQQLGHLDLSVEKRRAPHLTVETPFLAAVVKGTEFTVDVNEAGAEVSVSEGLVSVSDHDTGDTANVGAGQAVVAAAIAGTGLSVASTGSMPAVAKGRPTAPSIGVIGQQAATASASKGSNNAGGNASANSGGKGNAGGNGNGNGNAGENGNAGGNGNGNGNAGGNGNGNAGGNGNGNAGGNGNGNAGGNGNGKGRSGENDDD